MQEKDIQELFAHIKRHLNGKGTAPTLTKSVAAKWCRRFEGYTLDQLKEAANQQIFEKPLFWPDPGELMAHLPPRAAMVERGLDSSMLKAAEELPGLVCKLREMGYHDD